MYVIHVHKRRKKCWRSAQLVVVVVDGKLVETSFDIFNLTRAYNKYFYIEITLIKYLLQARIYKCCLFIIIITNRRQLTLRTAYTHSTIYLYTRKGEFFFYNLNKTMRDIYFTQVCVCAQHFQRFIYKQTH